MKFLRKCILKINFVNWFVYFIITGVIINLFTNIYFGWNSIPINQLEIKLDYFAKIMFVLGFCCIGLLLGEVLSYLRYFLEFFKKEEIFYINEIDIKDYDMFKKNNVNNNLH